ncbi:Saccharopine dehydrogenase / Homospermidine synthase [Corchorus olitorius]|uniref:Saccharopine dehydrogenase / Homospermidine synthase n=1 Tax=Corchorus olitorius TaxID=93759 RepID=A0A1R3IV07_9ROSI|nr:Saccharopine dehydrogenase / Homospermidine synthase [Corchorus olitorius]
MPLLDKILAERVSLYDYELIVGDHGYLSLGYSTPFLSLGASYMYPSLAAAKAAVISVGEEIASQGLPSGICPLVFIFTGSGNVSLGAQEIFKLLPHTFVEPSRLPELFGKGKNVSSPGRTSKRVYQVYGCVVTSRDMVKHKDASKVFDKADYYAHPEHYNPIFHEKIAPYASVIGRDVSDNLANGHSNKRFNVLVSLSGHLFDKFLINEALDMIEAAGGSFHLVKCQVGQSSSLMSYSELEVGADDKEVLDQIIDSLTSLANPSENNGRIPSQEMNKISLTVGKLQETGVKKETDTTKKKKAVLILGAGRVCQPAAELLASIGSSSSQQWYKTCLETDFEEQNDVHVIVASLYLKDAEEIVQGIPNTTAVELDVTDHGALCEYISQVEVVVSLLPPSCHVAVANVCIELKKHLVTASYVDNSMSMLDEKAKSAGITILGEMGLDPGIDHMMAMKMINQGHLRKGKIKSFTSYCGGLPSPAAANNPLAYKFSWNPAGAIRTGRNPATYKSQNKTVHVNGEDLYDSAVRFRIPDLPAFALECLPNRNSLTYGELFLGLHEQTEIPVSCQTAFAVTCHRMEERLAYSSTEQDMVLLHHEVEVYFPDSQRTERHAETLLEFGKPKNGKMISAMAFTVGVPVAIGALLLLVNKVTTRGVLRPIEPEVYVPALDILQAYGIKLMEKTE